MDFKPVSDKYDKLKKDLLGKVTLYDLLKDKLPKETEIYPVRGKTPREINCGLAQNEVLAEVRKLLESLVVDEDKILQELTRHSVPANWDVHMVDLAHAIATSEELFKEKK